MPAQLVALNDGPSILLDKPILLLGRHPECDIQIDSRKISRRHCCIAQVSDYLVVRDLGSTNGIRINGVRVQEGRLTGGDELTIGSHRYQVTWDSVPGSPNPGRPRVREDAQPRVQADVLDDAMLESSDEPVAIPEPGAPARAPVVAQADGSNGMPLTHEEGTEGGEESLILPENLQLAPSSDAARNASRQAPPPPPAV
jgi:pSer/pThr/pTyr-binding forkhead associated (FHA) protein